MGAAGSVQTTKNSKANGTAPVAGNATWDSVVKNIPFRQFDEHGKLVHAGDWVSLSQDSTSPAAKSRPAEEEGSRNQFSQVKSQVLATPAWAASRTSVLDYAWFVEDATRPGWWEAYPEETSRRLDEAVRQNESECLVVYKGKACTVHFERMEQSSGGTAATQRSRRVKRAPVTETAVSSSAIRPTADPPTSSTSDAAAGATVKHEKRLLPVDPFSAELGDDSERGADFDPAWREKSSAEESDIIKRQLMKVDPHLQLMSEALPVKGPLYVCSNLRVDPCATFRVPSATGQPFTFPSAIANAYTMVASRAFDVFMTGPPLGTISASYPPALGLPLDGDLSLSYYYPSLCNSGTPPPLQQVASSTQSGAMLAETLDHRDIIVAVGTQDSVAGLYHYQKDATMSPGDKAGQRLFVLRGHSNKVYSCRFTADHAQLVTSSMDASLRLWDVQTILSQDTKSAKKFTPLPSSHSQTFDNGTYGCVRLIQKPSDAVLFVTTTSRVHNWKALSGGMEMSITMHDFRLGNAAAGGEGGSATALELKGHTSTVWAIDLRENADMMTEGAEKNGGDSDVYIASGGMDNTVRIWDIRQPNTPLQTITSHTKPVHAVAFFRGAQRGEGGSQWLVASSGKDREIHIHDMLTGKLVDRVEQAHDGTIFRLFYNPYTGLLTTSGCDGAVKQWAWHLGC